MGDCDVTDTKFGYKNIRTIDLRFLEKYPITNFPRNEANISLQVGPLIRSAGT